MALYLPAVERIVFCECLLLCASRYKTAIKLPDHLIVTGGDILMSCQARTVVGEGALPFFSVPAWTTAADSRGRLAPTPPRGTWRPFVGVVSENGI